MKKGKVAFFIVVILMIRCIGGCGASEEIQMSDAKLLKCAEANVSQKQGPSEESVNDIANLSEIERQDAFVKETADFSVKLFKESAKEEENAMISPTSVLLALAMTENGASGDTREQMCKAMGSTLSEEDYHNALSSWYRGLPSDKEDQISIANSIWIRKGDQGFLAEEAFLQVNQQLYNSEIYEASFNGDTIVDINHWVSEKTHKMIPKMINELSDATRVVLVNAVAFDAKWEEQYTKADICENYFTNASGKEIWVSMMNSKEGIYLKDADATGFVKPYKNGYSFVAILPNEDTTVEEYMKKMNGTSFQSLLNNKEKCTVWAQMPKFKAEYDIQMNDSLKNMGIKDLFDAGKADLSRMGTVQNGNPLYISQVIHKTYISVDENGTKAAAVTGMTADCGGAVMDAKSVVLNRPFIYAIIENKSNLPIFIGTMQDVKE